MLAIKAIIFDFDGLICDTESTELHAWERLYADFRIPFPLNEYQKTIGAIHNDETPLWLLKKAVGERFNLENERLKLHHYHKELNEIEPLRPGVLETLKQAQKMHLKIGLASSSPRSWVDYHLDRLKIKDFFDCILTCNDVQKTKPDPELFLESLKCLEVKATETIALEDSVNGVLAAKAAGIITIAIPNEVTKCFSFNDADFLISSLENNSIFELLDQLK